MANIDHMSRKWFRIHLQSAKELQSHYHDKITTQLQESSQKRMEHFAYTSSFPEFSFLRVEKNRNRTITSKYNYVEVKFHLIQHNVDAANKMQIVTLKGWSI